MRELQRGFTKARVILTVLVIASVAAGSLLRFASAAAATRISQQSPIDGVWDGFWTTYEIGSQGYVYEASMTLASEANNSVSGQINWTMRRSGRSADDAKIGKSAIEFVRGSYDATNHVLRLAGYSKTDPDTVIALDRYHLLLADNGTVIGGMTATGGSWRGSLMTFKTP
jgi:hypothetical protein